MTVAINFSNRNIKVIMAERLKVTQWETVDLAPGLIKDGQIVQPEAVADILKGIFSQSKKTPSEIIAGVTGMSFVYRILTLPRLKNADLREAVERATQKEINLPLSDLYIDWQIVQEKGESIEVFVAGAPRGMVDALVRTFELANLKLAALDINALALARLVNQPRALIADFGRDWFDIVIVSQGLPVTLHSVATRGDFNELEDSLAQMSEEIRRTVEFYNLTHKENVIKPGEAVYLSGLNRGGGETATLIERYLPEAVNTPNGHVEYPGAFIATDYAVLLGLLLKNQASRERTRPVEGGYRNISLNLLAGQKRVLRSPLTLKQLVVPAAVVIAVLLLTPLLLARNNARGEIQNLESQLENINRELRIHRLILSETETTESQISLYLSETAKIRAERESISGPGDLAAALNYITTGFTPQMYFTSLISNSHQFIVEGRADSRAEVLSLAGYLEKGSEFKEVRIGSIEESTNPNPAVGDGLINQVFFSIIVER